MTEILGIIATVFVLLSFLQSKELYIRIINIIGAILFVIYGAILKAHSVYILNGVLILIHLIHIIKLANKKKKGLNDEGDKSNCPVEKSLN